MLTYGAADIGFRRKTANRPFTMLDLSQKPEIEYDDSTEDGSLTLSWLAADKQSMFSLVIRDGYIVGVNSTTVPPRGKPWRSEIPKGLIKIDCGVMRRLTDSADITSAREGNSPSEQLAPCETCNDDPEECAKVPGVRHCERANRGR